MSFCAALPVPGGLDSEVIPVLPGKVPSIESAPATVTETSPPLPGPEVVSEINSLTEMARLPALTVTLPASPLLPRSACDEILDLPGSPPSIESAPATFIETSPPFPGANVSLLISPLFDDPKGRRPGGFSFTPQGVLHGANEAFRAKFQAAPQFGCAHCARGA